MQQRIILVGALVSLGSVVSASNYYELPSTKRIEQDVYRSGKVFIETRNCYHYTYGETALLRISRAGEFSGSKIIWDDGSTCEVKRVGT